MDHDQDYNMPTFESSKMLKDGDQSGSSPKHRKWKAMSPELSTSGKFANLIEGRWEYDTMTRRDETHKHPLMTRNGYKLKKFKKLLGRSWDRSLTHLVKHS